MENLHIASDGANGELIPADYYLKPTATTHIDTNLSFIARKIFNLLIWHSQANRFSQKTEKLQFDELMQFIGLDKSHNQQVIKNALEALVSTKISWNTQQQDKTKNRWGVCTFLAGAEISRGEVRYMINPMLTEKIITPVVYAKIQLLIQAKFRSKYTLILYEYLVDVISRHKNQILSVEVSLDVLRNIFQYEGAYKTLNNDVLKPSTQEISSVTDLTLEVTPVKKSRSVVALIFNITRKGQCKPSPMLSNAAYEEELTDEQEKLNAVLLGKGILQRKARTLLLAFTEERIKQNIAYLEQELTKPNCKIRSIPAYLVKAIENNYSAKKMNGKAKKQKISNEKIAYVCKKQKMKLETETEQESEQKIEKIKKEFYAFRNERLKQYLAEKTPEWIKNRELQFIKDVNNNKYSILKNSFKRDGMKSKMIQLTFENELKDELLVLKEECDVRDYVEWKSRAVASLPK